MSKFDLQTWRRDRLAIDRAQGIPPPGRRDVTVIAYVFGTENEMSRYAEAIELALRETYRHCGRLKTTLVINRPTKALECFAAECGGDMRIDLDESLIPGDIVGFSRNMIRTLPERFDTEYMLNVHPDGFPLRPGLDEFIAMGYDYIGGAWDIKHDDWITRLLLNRNDGAGNGGFALRTRKICELGAQAYRRFWKMIPDCYLLYEDVFFTRFLPRWSPGYARQLKLAPQSDAARFAFCENLAAQHEYGQLPFGFHSWRAFGTLKLMLQRQGDLVARENRDKGKRCNMRDYLRRAANNSNDCFAAGSPQVTALMYFFWSEERAEEKWPEFLGALLETWRHCGKLKTVVVANAPHACICETAIRYPWLDIQIEPKLIPGDINSMSIDCISKLGERFTTDYVLIVQNDGFPLRGGLEEFVRLGYDYYGAPLCRPQWFPNLLTRVLNYCPQNGGFSLRSRRICRLVAKYYRRYYADKPFEVATMSEDLFYTMTLPRRHFGFWLRRRQAPSAVAARFSLEVFKPCQGKPFGFHQNGWKLLDE